MKRNLKELKIKQIQNKFIQKLLIGIPNNHGKNFQMNVNNYNLLKKLNKLK